jgi:hypothetical protein
LLHTWSLGIEEQFYLLWPLLAVLLLRLRRGEVWLRVVAVVGTVASTVWLIYLATGGADTSRLYYGTDTRVAALLVGAVVATMRPGLLVPKAPPAPEVPEEGAVLPPPPGASRRWSVRLVHGAGLAGAALLVVEIFVVRGEDPILYRGGFLVVALAAAALIAAAVALPRSRLARVLSVAPLRLLGRISYGVYLWHWPVQLAVTHVRTHLSGPVLFLARLGVTLLLATLSYQLVELPVRRRRWAVSWPRRSAALVAVSATLVAIVLGTSLAVPQQQSQSSILSESRIGTSGQVPTASPAAAPEPAIPARSLTADSTAPRAPLGHPLRVMLTGDSIAATLGWNLGPLLTQTNTQLYLDAPLGCGLVLGKHNDRGRIIADPSDCASWPQRWSNEVRQYTPDVVAVLVGRWEMTDRFYAGAWRHLGDPVFDDYVRAQLERAVQVGGSRGAQVALLNPPCLQDVERPDGGAWPQNDPARAQRFADLQKEVVARHPKNVEILDLAGLICPGGKFARVIGGVQVRDRDGVHFTVSGARFVGRSLLPALQSIAEEAQFRRVLQVLAQRGISSSS